MLEIKAIGIGGIGCALLPFLCRYLNYAGERARLTLIDGDSFDASTPPARPFPAWATRRKSRPGNWPRNSSPSPSGPSRNTSPLTTSTV